MITLRGKLQRSIVARPKKTTTEDTTSAPHPATSSSTATAAAAAADGSNLAITERQPAASSSSVATTTTTATSKKDGESGGEMEMVEEWSWQGVWAFGTLPNNQEEIDKLMSPTPTASADDVSSPDINTSSFAQQQQFSMEDEELATESAAAAAATANNDDTKNLTATDLDAPKNNNQQTPSDSNNNNTPNQSPSNWIQKLSSIITGSSDSHKKSSEESSSSQQQTSQQKQQSQPQKPIIKKRGRGRPPKSSYSPAEAAAQAAKEAARKAVEERERNRPRPFVYKWCEMVNAADVVVPSSLIVVTTDTVDGAGGGNGGGDEETGDDAGKGEALVAKKNVVKTNTTMDDNKRSDDKKVVANLEEDVVMKDAVKQPSTDDDAAASAVDDNNSSNNNNNTPKQTKKSKGVTYAEPPYTDATTNYPPNTCPNSGKWEGHFENVTLKKGRQNNRIKEVFYLFFNGTPSSDAHDAFIDGDLTMKANAMLDDRGSTDVATSSDNDSSGDDDEKKKRKKLKTEDDDSKHLLKEGCIHVRGHGTNRFGTFEIVGSYDPKTEILQCQRMYVPVQDEKGGSGTKKRGRRSRSEAARLLAESAKAVGGDGGVDIGDDVGRYGSGGGRKRKTSWKTRSKDMSSFGDETTPTTATGKGDIASIVKKRSRLSNDSAPGGGNKSSHGSGGRGSGTASMPQCRGGLDGSSSLKINMSALKNPPTYKPSPSPASTIGSGKKKGGKKKASPSFQGPFPGAVVPIAPVPTLPTEGDPFLARWRAAHYLYYQRIEHKPDDDGQPTWGVPSNPSPGNYSVTVKSVVYEGEMHDGVREGRGLCLYNNNLMYEGEWKRNKEHGKGILMSPDRKRIIYEGDWEKGRMQGKGSYYYYDALNNEKETSKYIGDFKENLRHGLGVYTLPDGSIYDGEWRENNPNGWGLFRWPDGSEYQGPWKDGKRNGTNGILIAADGFRYEGAWANNAMEGIGVATYPNGQVYEGKFVGGRREGRGTIRFTNGAVCKCTVFVIYRHLDCNNN